MPAENSGFFLDLSRRIADAINAHFKDGQLLEVKNIRKIMDVKGSDRSAVIFFARVLGVFDRMGFLKNGAGRMPKRYTKVRDIAFTPEELAKNV